MTGFSRVGGYGRKGCSSVFLLSEQQREKASNREIWMTGMSIFEAVETTKACREFRTEKGALQLGHVDKKVSEATRGGRRGRE